MKYIIFSDLHNNYYALKSLYQYLIKINPKEVKLYFLGDLIGYYKFDFRSIKLLMKMKKVWEMDMIIGNHDAAFFNHLGITNFNVNYSVALDNTIKDNIINKEEIKQILPNIQMEKIKIKIDNRQYILSHGGISDIINDYYYPDLKFTYKNKNMFDYDVSYICGHTHRPFIANSESNIFINVGSLGIPRDGDPRLCFLEIDNNTFNLKRFFYNLDFLYEYNIKLNNNIKNIIYFGGKSNYLKYDLLKFEDDYNIIIENFNIYWFFKRAIYIEYKGNLLQVFKLDNINNYSYLLRTSSSETLLNNIEDVVRRIKDEKI